MDKQNDEKWLDELISRTINTEKPHFESEKWKQEYPDEYQALLSRADKRGQPSIWRMIIRHPIAQLAAAAVIIVAVGLLFIEQDRQAPNGTEISPRPIAQSAVKKMSLMSLKMAYQRGGFDALDRQFRETLNAMEPQPLNVSMQELLEGANGS
jgi:hypothetical protein